MGLEGRAYAESPRQERYLGELDFGESARFQTELATIVYARCHPDMNIESISGNTIMLWWITKGCARAYGDYITSPEAKNLDVSNEDDLEQLLFDLGVTGETIH